VVHRHLSKFRWILAGLAVLTIGCVALASAGPADAANRRIAISNFAWSDPEPSIDLGEKVTWYWTGPDVLHSVTGSGPAAAGLDSDSGRATPLHTVGDSFTHAFDSPGTYHFVCKIHGSLPGGTVTVSSTPGDPDTEVDPVPQNNVDTIAPKVNGLSLTSPAFGSKGTELFFALDERSSVSAEIWGLRKGRLGRYAGWQEWQAFIGFNWLEFGKSTRHFKPRPGRYRAFVYATDDWNNESRPGTVDFTIR
jgi:plastocyanin